MIDTFGTALAVPVAFLLMLLAPVVIEAQNPADRDAKEIADYMLTEPALAKYKQAVHKLQPLIAQLPQDCERENGSTSLKDMATRMDAIPGVKSALKAAGMTSREYLVFTWSVFQSGMAVLAVQQPGGKLPPV
jgi:hypothetical protein